VKFDSEGVSIEEYEREVAEKLIGASNSLSIHGEKKVAKKESFKLDEVLADVGTKSDSFTQEQVTVIVRENAERLISSITESLGLDPSVIERALISPTVPGPQVLISEEYYRSLTDPDYTDGEDVAENKSKTEESLFDAIAPSSEVESPEVQDARQKMGDLKIDQLREILVERGVPEDSWKSLKGNDGKEKMINIIISFIKEGK